MKKYASVIFAVLAALLVRFFVLGVYKVPTQSMAPQILAGDYVMGSKVAYGFKSLVDHELYFAVAPRLNDLVIYQKNNKTFIKRILALKGDEFEYTNAELIVNSIKCSYNPVREISQPSLLELDENCGGLTRRILRPKDLAKFSQNIAKQRLDDFSLLVGADNRSFEIASNAVDLIRYDQIVGKPLFVWLSYSSTQDFISDTLGIRWNRILTNLR